MSETLDYNKLSEDIVSNIKKIPFEQNKQYFTRLAFDVFQNNNSNVEDLWCIEDGEDGKQYLVARYSDKPEQKEIKSCWFAFPDKDSKNITLIYKDTPIYRFASSDYNFNSDDVYIFQKALVQKLSSDKSFITKLLNFLPKEKQEVVLSLFPELA